MRKTKPLNSLRKRRAQYFHLCCVCLNDIEPGEDYHDGGYYRRAHVDCANAQEVKPNLIKSSREQSEFLDSRYRKQAKALMSAKGGGHG